MKTRLWLLLLALTIAVGLAASAAGGQRQLVLATTTSTKDTGLLDYLLPRFEKASGLMVKVIAVGTGQALKLGEMGDCDVVLVHARAAEDKFVAGGFGVNRRDVMYNDFVLVGPAGDPARIKGRPVLEAMQALAEGKGIFLSRGDGSGTNQKEKEIWAKTGVKPEGQWYKSVGKGMGDTLVMADEMQAYTLSDRGTFAAMRNRLGLVILVAGDAILYNPYGVIAVNPKRNPGVNYDGARAFIEFLTSKETRQLIEAYKIDGEQIFHAL